MRVKLSLIALAVSFLALAGMPGGAQAQGMCADGTGPQTIGKPYEPTVQGSYCDVRGGGGRPHKGVDMMQSEGYLAPIPVGCKIMMNGDTPIWCQGTPNGVGGYGYYMRFACGKRVGPDGKEYKVEVRYAHIKGYDATMQKAIVSCSGCVGITPHVHYETLVEGRKVNPVCVWGEGISNNVSCPAGLSKPANLCDGGELKILHEQACFCPGFGCGGPGAVTSMNYHDGVDPSSISGTYGPPGGGTSCGAQNDSGGSANNPGNVGGGGGSSSGGTGEGPNGDGGQGTPNPNYQENEEGCSTCCCPCTQTIIENHKRIRRHVDVFDKDDEQSEFEEHRNWMVYTFLQQHILPAMMMMTSQLTAVGVEQVRIIGTFLDAKHQLETQRMFQQMAARAHKDYHPSEGMCEVGTVTRSLLASERRSDLAQMAIAQYALKRQLFSGDIVSKEGGISDDRSRGGNFIANYCDVKDNANGLNLLCKHRSVEKDRQNADIDFMRSLESKLTLELDITAGSDEEGAFNFDGFATQYASLVPESGSSLTRYARKARHDNEFARLSGSGFAAGLIAAHPRDAKITLVQTVQNPIAVDDERTMDSQSNTLGGNVFDNDGVDPLTTKVTTIAFGSSTQKAVPEFASVMIDGHFGTLTIHSAGNYTYALDDFAGAYGQKERFTYTITAVGVGSADADIIISFPTGNGSGGSGSGGNGGNGGNGSGNGGSGNGGSGSGGDGNGTGGGTGTDAGGATGMDEAGLSPDFENVLSMNGFLFAHTLPTYRAGTIYANEEGLIHPDSVPYYMDMRSLIAKRSVAVNSFAAITGERVSGDPEAAPFIKRLVAELGIPEDEVEQITGKSPSYFAQMEVLTKKIYENPTFYTELYDKPVNVGRKAVALKAIGLMQDRDMYQSMLRTEMLGSVLLETILMKEQEALKNEMRPTTGPARPVLGSGGGSE